MRKFQKRDSSLTEAEMRKLGAVYHREILSIQELSTLKAVVNRTWENIAQDLVEIVGSPATRDSVFEVVTDRLNDFAHSPSEKRLVGKFLSLSFKKMQDLKVELLPMERYE